jgi:N-acetylmuramoyl-L-alanine amidase
MDIGAAEITAWHIARGWTSIGYNWVIRRNGVIEKGRDLDNDGDSFNEVGAHALGFNSRSLGICLVGGRSDNNEPEDNFTSEQMHALAYLLDAIEARVPGIEILGHRDLPGVTKACPCFDVRAWWYND